MNEDEMESVGDYGGEGGCECECGCGCEWSEGMK